MKNQLFWFEKVRVTEKGEIFTEGKIQGQIIQNRGQVSCYQKLQYKADLINVFACDVEYKNKFYISYTETL